MGCLACRYLQLERSRNSRHPSPDPIRVEARRLTGPQLSLEMERTNPLNQVNVRAVEDKVIVEHRNSDGGAAA